ncbi:MAG: glutamate 5-kinase [Candidatus Tectomicrobia bacterium]|nr:glutamate 5-kinase [Candidatus Tectomicrobia bacterium]
MSRPDRGSQQLPHGSKAGAKRLVLKVGSAVLTGGKGKLDVPFLRGLAGQVAAARQAGYEVVLVSSGAIAAGRGALGLPEGARSIPEMQAAAAVGQSSLIGLYARCFTRHGLTVAQLLLTHDDFSDRQRYLNARNTLQTLLAYGAVPIINENDTVSVEEIKFGDNDTLSALVASLLDADLLLMLSDVEGLYSADPRANADARLISRVRSITPQMLESASVRANAVGRGGMRAKLEAAKRATRAGIRCMVINGRPPTNVRRALAGEPVGTTFEPQARVLKGRKWWILHTLKPQGMVQVDDGAKRALIEQGRSLLPSGVLEVTGNFHFADAVLCCDKNKQAFARGLVNYDAQALRRIRGLHTSKIAEILGSKEYDEVIHRDDLVLLEQDDL